MLPHRVVRRDGEHIESMLDWLEKLNGTCPDDQMSDKEFRRIVLASLPDYYSDFAAVIIASAKRSKVALTTEDLLAEVTAEYERKSLTMKAPLDDVALAASENKNGKGKKGKR